MKFSMAETPEWGVTEVATTPELPTSTTFDIVASLAAGAALLATPSFRREIAVPAAAPLRSTAICIYCAIDRELLAAVEVPLPAGSDT